MVRNFDRNTHPNDAHVDRAYWWFGAWLAMTAILIAPTVLAQPFHSEPVDPLLRTKSRTVQQSTKDPSRYASEKELVQQFFRGYFFPAMTQASPEALGELGDRRIDFFRLYVRPAGSTAQNDLTDMAFEFAKKVVPDARYHPAVRYNAVLMLGLLDDQYASDSGGQERRPQPKRDATELLIQIVKLAGKNPRVTPGLLVGTLVGLERHARLADSLPAPLVAEMRTTLLDVVAHNEQFGEEEPDVHQWIRRQAVDALTRLPGTESAKQSVQAVLLLINDPDNTLDERCEAAAFLDRIRLAESGIDATTIGTIGRSLVMLASDVGADEAIKAQKFEDSQISPLRGRSRGRFDNTPARYERSRLLARLEKLKDGLDAEDAVAAGDVKTRVAATLDAITSVQTIGFDEKELDLDLARVIKQMARAIEDIANSWEATAPAAPTAEDDE